MWVRLPPSAPRFCRGVAQPGRAPRSGRGGRWFKSTRPDHSSSTSASVANPLVARHWFFVLRGHVLHPNEFFFSLPRALILLLIAGVLVSGCNVLVGGVPMAPSPFPTIPRLPSVTPEPPTPTFAPTRTPAPTPTPRPLQVIHATAVGDANVRAGPATDFTIINTVVKGEQVTIHSRIDDWYYVTLPDGTMGWMADIVLTINPRLVDAIPTATPTTTP